MRPTKGRTDGNHPKNKNHRKPGPSSKKRRVAENEPEAGANIRKNASSNYTLFDLVITYGTQVEVYRSVDISLLKGAKGSLDQVINGVSALVTVQPITGNTYGTVFPSSGTTPPAIPAHRRRPAP